MGSVLFGDVLLVDLGVPQLGHYLPGVSASVKVVGVSTSFLLASLLATLARKHMLFVVEIEVLVFVEILGHLNFWTVINGLIFRGLFYFSTLDMHNNGGALCFVCFNFGCTKLDFCFSSSWGLDWEIVTNAHVHSNFRH